MGVTYDFARRVGRDFEHLHRSGASRLCMDRRTDARHRPTVEQKLVAIRHLFEWLIAVRVVPSINVRDIDALTFQQLSKRTPVIREGGCLTLRE